MNLPELPDLQWKSVLHWCLRVMDYDDPLVTPAAELFADCCTKGFLTAQQNAEASVIYGTIQDRFDRGELACQQADFTDLINAPSTPRRQ